MTYNLSNKLDNLWNRIAHFFEYGDLTPLAVLVSVAHYGPVLVAHGEHAVIAYIIGTLVDMLHFRTVRRVVFSFNYKEAAIAVLTTAMALGYHMRFYSYDLLLAVPIPLGIAILAYHAAIPTKTHESRLKDSETRVKELETKLQETESMVKSLEVENKTLKVELKTFEHFNQVVRDIGHMMSYGGVTQKQIAQRHGLSEAKVSRLAGYLNGGLKVEKLCR